MGYYLSDVTGYLADGPSLTGWRRLRDEVLVRFGGPVTHAFVRDGVTEQVEALAEELSGLTSDAPSVAASLERLQEASQAASGVLILGTGVSDQPEPDDEMAI